MAEDIYDILNILNDIRELLERENNKGNYSNPINNPYVRTVMDSPMVHNIMKTDKKTGEKVDTGVLDFKSLEKSINALITQLHLNNTETRTYIKTAISQIEQDYDKLTEDKQIPYIERSIDALFKEMVRLSSQLSESPLLNVDQKKAQSDPKTQEYLKFYKQQLMRTDQTNATLAKIFEFFGKDKAERKGRTRQFIDDLADGLGKSKFIGGAFIDLIRLATFFAANWLKQFGPIGKALAVTLVALGPIIGAKIAGILVKALSSVIVNTFKWGFSSLGALLKTVFLSLTNRNAAANFIGGKAMPGLVRGGVALGLGAISYGLGKTAVDTWKEGGSRNKTAAVGLGLGSAGFGVGAFTTLLAPLFPILAPIAPIAIAVGAIAGGIGLIVKFWPQISEFFKMVGEKLGIIAKDKDEHGNYYGGAPSTMDNLSGRYAGMASGKLKESTKGGRDLNAKDLAAWNAADKQEAILNEYGAVTNFGRMTQAQVGREMEKIRAGGRGEEARKRWNDLYEVIPFVVKDKDGKIVKTYANPSNFTTDAITPDGLGFYAAKGTRARLDAANRYLESKGYKGNLQISAGIATAGSQRGDEWKHSPHKLTGKGHDSPYGAKIDVGESSMRLVTNAAGQVASHSLIKEALGSAEAFYSPNGKGIEYEDTKGNEHFDIHYIPGSIKKLMDQGVVAPSIPISDSPEKNKEAVIEATKASVRMAEKDYNDYLQEVTKGNKDLTLAEQEALTEKAKVWTNAKEAQKKIEKLNVKEFEGDYTGNLKVSKILTGIVDFSNFSKPQQ